MLLERSGWCEGGGRKRRSNESMIRIAAIRRRSLIAAGAAASASESAKRFARFKIGNSRKLGAGPDKGRPACLSPLQLHTRYQRRRTTCRTTAVTKETAFYSTPLHPFLRLMLLLLLLRMSNTCMSRLLPACLSGRISLTADTLQPPSCRQIRRDQDGRLRS